MARETARAKAMTSIKMIRGRMRIRIRVMDSRRMTAKVISSYYTKKGKGLPPGQAKKNGNLPPGLEKQLSEMARFRQD